MGIFTEIGIEENAKEISNMIRDQLDAMKMGFQTDSAPVEAEGEDGFILMTDSGHEYIVIIKENKRN